MADTRVEEIFRNNFLIIRVFQASIIVFVVSITIPSIAGLIAKIDVYYELPPLAIYFAKDVFFDIIIDDIGSIPAKITTFFVTIAPAILIGICFSRFRENRLNFCGHLIFFTSILGLLFNTICYMLIERTEAAVGPLGTQKTIDNFFSVIDFTTHSFLFYLTVIFGVKMLDSNKNIEGASSRAQDSSRLSDTQVQPKRTDVDLC